MKSNERPRLEDHGLTQEQYEAFREYELEVYQYNSSRRHYLQMGGKNVVRQEELLPLMNKKELSTFYRVKGVEFRTVQKTTKLHWILPVGRKAAYLKPRSIFYDINGTKDYAYKKE